MTPDWITKAITTEEGTWRPCVHNAMLLLENHERTRGRIRYNSFSLKVEVLGELPRRTAPADVWQEVRDVHITWLRELFDPTCTFNKDMMHDALEGLAARTHVHPVREYLAAQRWDGVARLDELFTRYFVSEDTPLHREAGAKFAVGAVARVMLPGCKLDTLPVLEGEQGLMKSSGVAALLPERAWFSDTPFDINSKEAYQVLTGVWIYEIGELQSFTRAEATRIKNFLSSSEDRYRPPYGRLVQSFPRQTVFVGTTNDTDYVSDHTGERRKWPVPVQRVDLEAIARDRDQLWAEAVVRYEAGERWYLEGESAKAMSEEAMERHVEDPMFEGADETIRTELLRLAGTPEYMTNQDVYALLGLRATEMSPGDSKRLARSLRKLGLIPKKRKVSGRVANTWTLPETLRTEIDEARKRRGSAARGLAPSA